LYLLRPDALSRPDDLALWTLAFRGFIPRDRLPSTIDGLKITVPWSSPQKKVSIAVTSWETGIDSWKASVINHPEPDNGRYRRLNHLLNTILRSHTTPSYVILPELSIPRAWFLRMATKLSQRGISLVAGVDYLHHYQAPNTVSNQIWASLVSDFLGFRSLVIYRQDKQQPALHEEKELWEIGGKGILAT
ncbi:MAG: Reverse transcriptase, partial [Candidatus Latescibacteria bacterium]|nr:Reverse transcriptase [Candidatus Latescibacterota bacterium]